MLLSAPKPLAELIGIRKFNVNPIVWTSYHLDAVGCRFEDVDIDATEDVELVQQNNDSPLAHQKSLSAIHVRQLSKSCAPRVKLCCLINLLKGEGRVFSER